MLEIVTSMNAETLYSIGLALIFGGILVILAAVILIFLASLGGGERKVKGGGTIIIGPFPIIFGTDKESIKTVLILSLALTIILIIGMVIFHFMLK